MSSTNKYTGRKVHLIKFLNWDNEEPANEHDVSNILIIFKDGSRLNFECCHTSYKSWLEMVEVEGPKLQAIEFYKGGVRG